VVVLNSGGFMKVVYVKKISLKQAQQLQDAGYTVVVV